MALLIDSAGAVKIRYIYNGATVDSSGSLGFGAGAWHHIAVSVSGTTVTFYLDGASKGTATVALPTWNANGVKTGGVTAGFSTLLSTKIDEAVVYDRALTTSDIAALSQGTLAGFYEKRYFDSIGRTTRSVRRDLLGALTSWETFGYNFQDQITTRTMARNSTATFTTTYAYDFLGRPTFVTYPGTAPPVTVSYDDGNRIRTVVAENGRKVQYLYDVGGRMTAVREYYDATNYYTTSYAYDEVGNLLSVTNALNQVTNHTYDNRNRLTKTTYPDITKFETYAYDEVGNLRTKTDRAGQVTTYTYEPNARYRLTSIDYGSTTPNPDIGYAYDLNDNPTTITNYATNPATTVAYVYDGIDRATNETDTISGRSYSVGYAYDPAGRLTQLTYPDNAAISYVYDSVGRTSQVKDASATYGSFAYSADDLTNNVTFGNGIVQSYAFNGRGWPTSIKAAYGQSTYLDIGYTYDNSGNVLTMGPASFTYDKLDRLVTARGGFGSHTYSYDALGNRLQLDNQFILRPSGPGSSAQWTPVGSCSANWD